VAFAIVGYLLNKGQVKKIPSTQSHEAILHLRQGTFFVFAASSLSLAVIFVFDSSPFNISI
jgi:hypothetical protein